MLLKRASKPGYVFTASSGDLRNFKASKQGEIVIKVRVLEMF